MGALLVTAAAICLLACQSAAQSRRWGEGYFPNHPVVTQTGETLRFYDDIIKGRIVVISFFFTRCTEICPLATARLAQAAELLGDELGKRIHFVSISVDPANDTAERLADYAGAFHSGPGWLFLTGTTDDIRAINAKLGERMSRLEDHRNEVLLGNDATGEWQRNTIFGDVARLADDILSMDPERRARERRLGGAANGDQGRALPAVAGQALFSKLCAACHGTGLEGRIGPNLLKVGERRSREWLRRYIMSPGAMRREADATAHELATLYPTVRMPELGLSESDADDLISYIGTRSSRR